MSDFKPHIGKNVIETLTLGMYEDARIIYREYVQNAADQIDVAVEEKILKSKSDGEIKIKIDKDAKTISIEDNATGIESDNVLSFLGDVANSQKDMKKRKGFRGIGRLGGLGYCEQLIFETSYKGETEKNIITLDAKLLKEIIDNDANTDDAATVMGTITRLVDADEDKNAHYFKVSLLNVTNEILLNVDSISKYLSMVAPIPFHKNFKWKDKIYAYYRKNKVGIDEYDIHLDINDQKLTKPYKSVFYKTKNKGKKDERKEVFSNLIDVVCFDEVNDEGELIAIGWFGITGKLNFQIPDENIEAGIRLRKENIAIGSKFTLSKLFGQSRQNLNYIGEVHAIGSGFKPNARRDYFNDSKSITDLEKKLKSQFAKFGTITQDSSDAHNRKYDIEDYREGSESFEKELRSGQLTKKEIEKKREDLLNKKDKAIKASKKLAKLKDKSTHNSILSTVYEEIVGDLNLKIDEEEPEIKAGAKSYPLNLSKLSKEQKEVVLQIFTILEENLTIEKAEFIKKKIAEKFN